MPNIKRKRKRNQNSTYGNYTVVIPMVHATKSAIFGENWFELMGNSLVAYIDNPKED